MWSGLFVDAEIWSRQGKKLRGLKLAQINRIIVLFTLSTWPIGKRTISNQLILLQLTDLEQTKTFLSSFVIKILREVAYYWDHWSTERVSQTIHHHVFPTCSLKLQLLRSHTTRLIKLMIRPLFTSQLGLKVHCWLLTCTSWKKFHCLLTSSHCDRTRPLDTWQSCSFVW